MNKIKLIALDMDGTLLDDQKQVSKENKEMIDKAIRQGIYVIICTGRMYRSAKTYGTFFKERMPIITYNGALIRELNDGKILYHKQLREEIKSPLYTTLEKYDLRVNVYVNDYLFGKEGNDYIEDYAGYTGVPYTLYSPNDLAGFMKENPVTKLVGIGDPEKIKELMDREKPLFEDKVYFSKSFDHFLETADISVNKGEGLKQLGKLLGIGTQEMMGIGDGLNDSEMLATVGHPVIMGNGHQDLMDKGYYLTKSNNDSGVAYAISEHI